MSTFERHQKVRILRDSTDQRWGGATATDVGDYIGYDEVYKRHGVDIEGYQWLVWFDEDEVAEWVEPESSEITVEELNALPLWSIALADDGWASQKVGEDEWWGVGQYESDTAEYFASRVARIVHIAEVTE